MNKEIDDLIKDFYKHDYILNEALATSVFLLKNLGKPLLLEGSPGVGKTVLAKTLAQHLGTDLIRLQCYEGLDVSTSIYEWNYQKQLLHIKLFEQETDKKTLGKEIFGMDYVLKRPLLQSISADKPVVLLIDEIDRADEEFEAYLLELLSDFQISIPELGTITARTKPLVILTSNRTRELSDALRRRCLYHWVDFPTKIGEIRIISKKLPDIDEQLATQVVTFIHNLRKASLHKPPGIAESLDWAKTLLLMNQKNITDEIVKTTIGSVLKHKDDVEFVTNRSVQEFLVPID
ncbi:MoxR family ATPase [Robertkochia marina]|uniref:MoxR family ATPase n=1 Tax=Robertkochia marina TaxID=1227945 RepID=A0A4S3M1B1_9FLAO|nr:MoxR family ATPase [Robertkochia marina]THD68872.1 MoxR family ATPase [Robertkochia marina]TRZ41118.1 MoxR family ATPase [Robertkochia marina]